MEVLKIQYKPGTIVKCTKSGEVLKIYRYSGVYVYFSDFFTGETAGKDYFNLLGKTYIKDKTARVLYGHN